MIDSPVAVACAACGVTYSEAESFCPACGTQRISWAEDGVRPPPAAARRALGGAFGHLEPAGTGARLAAFTGDLLVLGLVAGLAWWRLPLALAAATVAEYLLVMWIWQARTGLGPGNLVCGLRTTRAALPRPAGGRAVAGRAALEAVALAVVAAGGWVLEASGRWDPAGEGRAWHDRLTSTRVVVAPRLPSSHPRLPGGGGSRAEKKREAAAFEPPKVSAPMTARSQAELAEVAEVAGVAGVPGAQGGALTPGEMDATALQGAADLTAPAPRLTPAPLPAPRQAEAVLVFDTGQSVLVAIPGTALLGRSPSAAGSGLQLVRIDDPDKTVSKNHLRLELDAEGVAVTDLGSTNGSAVVAGPSEEVALAPQETRSLPHGTTIRLGDRTFVTAVQGGGGG
jgi:hypothetical protein